MFFRWTLNCKIKIYNLSSYQIFFTNYFTIESNCEKNTSWSGITWGPFGFQIYEKFNLNLSPKILPHLGKFRCFETSGCLSWFLVLYIICFVVLLNLCCVPSALHTVVSFTYYWWRHSIGSLGFKIIDSFHLSMFLF